ncbi:hypothetical protein ACSBR1_014420 [Camellia fascicularis]
MQSMRNFSELHESTYTINDQPYMRLLQTLGLSNIQVESDCKSVIDLSVSELDPPWDCLAIVHDIQAVAFSSSCVLSWMPREASSVAHWVASAHLKNALPLDWVRIIPFPLLLLDSFL